MFEGIEKRIENLSPASANPVMELELNARNSELTNQTATPTSSRIGYVVPSPTRMVKTNFIMPNQEKTMPSSFSPSPAHPYSPISKANSPCLIDLPVLRIDDSQDEVIKKLDTLQADVADIKTSLATLQQQQHANTVKIMIMLDNIIKDFKKNSEKNLEEQSRSVLEEDNILEKYAFPLSDITILKKMDRDLSQEIYFLRMVKYFSSFIGADGQGRGEVLGKKMAEQIMTRELMTKMSWTGVSRTAGFERKFAFQTLENIVKLFYKVLLKADSRWSFEKNEKLFSGALLKHAKKRAIAEKEKIEKKKKHGSEENGCLEQPRNDDSTTAAEIPESEATSQVPNTDNKIQDEQCLNM